MRLSHWYIMQVAYVPLLIIIKNGAESCPELGKNIFTMSQEFLKILSAQFFSSL